MVARLLSLKIKLEQLKKVNKMTAEFYTGFNDFLWFRTKPAPWVKTKEQKADWNRGQKLARENCK